MCVPNVMAIHPTAVETFHRKKSQLYVDARGKVEETPKSNMAKNESDNKHLNTQSSRKGRWRVTII